MAHIWFLNEKGEWTLCPTAATILALTNDASQPVRVRSDVKDDEIGVLRKSHCMKTESWLLITPYGSEVRVNGVCNHAGIRLLDDRDEIVLPHGRRLYFSTEELASVQPFPGNGGKPVYCPRCKQPIADGSPAVRCPSGDCGVWHHESEELPCWTYAEHCTLCPQTTGLDGGYGWTPEDLENG